jgi:hypothetical protein
LGNVKPLTLPKSFSAEGEVLPKLKRFKSARARKWSFGSRRSWRDMADLATYLLALGRHSEAAEIGEFVSSHLKFKGDYGLWSPATLAIAVGARCLRLIGQPERADVVFAPVREVPSSNWSRTILEQIFRETPDAIRSGSALSVASAHILLLEEARAGRAGTEWCPTEFLEAQLQDALIEVRKKLEGGAGGRSRRT